MSDEEPWAQTMPFVRELTRRGIGQLWVHHSGHDKTRGFGTSTREWQMDTVIHLEEAKLEHSDLSFKLAFKKSREKTPATRADFEEAKIALLNDQWVHEVQASAKAKASPRRKNIARPCVLLPMDHPELSEAATELLTGRTGRTDAQRSVSSMPMPSLRFKGPTSTSIASSYWRLV